MRAAMGKDKQLTKAKNDIIDNIEAIQLVLRQCESEGMADFESSYYNELSALHDDTRVVETWDELMEVVSRAKTLETDIDGWLSFHGRTTFSLIWPNQPD